MSELTEGDRALIAELRTNGRVPLTILSRRLGVPRVTLLDRLKRLQKAGVIRRFTVVVDPEKEDRGMTAFVLINFEKGQVDQQRVVEAVLRLPGVVEAHDVAGEPDLFVKVRGRSLKEIGDRVVSPIRNIRGVGSTTTLPCFATFKEEW